MMAKLTGKQLQKRDAARNIGDELLKAVRDMKRGHASRTHKVAVPVAAAARAKTGLTQTQFAVLLGVSVRTLQEWEQGRRGTQRFRQGIVAHRAPASGSIT